MEKEKAEKIWNTLCVHINKNRNSLEKELQENIVLLFTELGWSKLSGEIIPENELRIGSNGKLRPDITIKNNDKKIIVIELKRNNNHNTNKSEPQLFSYILQSDVKFGILIGGNLQFYYKIPEEKPIKIFETEFSEHNEQAAEFISLIGKPFEENKLSEFCKKRILNKEDEEQFKELKNRITDGDFDFKIKTLFIEFLQNKYNEQIANKISDEIEVKILPKNSPIRNEKFIDRNSDREREQFTFSKVGIYPGTKLVFTRDPKKECTVIKSKDDRTVSYKNAEYNLSPLAQELSGNDNPLRGIRFFKRKGDEETLEERFDSMRKRM